MARVLIAKSQLVNSYSNAGVVLTETAADATNFNYFPMVGGEVVLCRNSGAVSRNVTLTPPADRYNRAGTTVIAVPAGATLVLGPIPTDGWQQSNGQYYLQANHAEVMFAVLTPPVA